MLNFGAKLSKLARTLYLGWQLKGKLNLYIRRESGVREISFLFQNKRNKKTLQTSVKDFVFSAVKDQGNHRVPQRKKHRGPQRFRSEGNLSYTK
ncbi:hypothetical protein D1614_18190 [Maribellus luteus]|uniref:Uncharacterized protein n=1 Tax=Maribellus luteus TaxID=2305463 RepID=A0A399SS41_9BACT|nr:hypothetical protein D1614_18190 [Maribellus luteus]